MRIWLIASWHAVSLNISHHSIAWWYNGRCQCLLQLLLLLSIFGTTILKPNLCTHMHQDAHARWCREKMKRKEEKRDKWELVRPWFELYASMWFESTENCWFRHKKSLQHLTFEMSQCFAENWISRVVFELKFGYEFYLFWMKTISALALAIRQNQQTVFRRPLNEVLHLLFLALLLSILIRSFFSFHLSSLHSAYTHVNCTFMLHFMLK